jgi:hypothetical protein
VATDIDVNRVAPIVVDTLIDDAAAGRKLPNAVGAGTERWLKRGRFDIAFIAVLVGPLPPRLGQDGELPKNLR